MLFGRGASYTPKSVGSPCSGTPLRDGVAAYRTSSVKKRQTASLSCAFYTLLSLLSWDFPARHGVLTFIWSAASSQCLVGPFSAVSRGQARPRVAPRHLSLLSSSAFNWSIIALAAYDA